jgi:GT2 family glycosyltransferase
MKIEWKDTIIRRAGDFWLAVIVHFDAFRIAPVPYLTAAKWWILGKRVRARGQLATLLNQSKRAYQLWALRDNRRPRQASPHGASPAIIALLDVARSSDIDAGYQMATRLSLAAEGLPIMLIGSNHHEDLDAVVQSIDWSASPWLMPILAGDLLAPGAAEAYRAACNDPQVRLLYADDDELDRWNRRLKPHFKPKWNKELFRHADYITGSCIVRADADDISKVANHSDWAARLVSNVATRGTAKAVQKMLHHRRTRPVPPAAAAPLELADELPLVSVIIPTRNRVNLLKTCVAGLSGTDYPNLEVIVVDNDSDDTETLAWLHAFDGGRTRVLRHPGPFNYSMINNRAVAEARGQLICLLNNDIEVLSPNWLAIMATQALRDDVGAVGARLLYPDGRIQHSGVIIGVGNAAGHAHRFVRPEEEGYFNRHNLPQFSSAVTAACLVVKRDRFLKVGGLDEVNFPVAFNDVDLCLRLNAAGWQSLYEPRATLIHHESVSRGFDLDPLGARRFAGELAALQRIWKTDEVVDPFHHPQLSRASERFAVTL